MTSSRLDMPRAASKMCFWYKYLVRPESGMRHQRCSHTSLHRSLQSDVDTRSGSSLLWRAACSPTHLSLFWMRFPPMLPSCFGSGMQTAVPVVRRAEAKVLPLREAVALCRAKAPEVGSLRSYRQDSGSQRLCRDPRPMEAFVMVDAAHGLFSS